MHRGKDLLPNSAMSPINLSYGDHVVNEVTRMLYCFNILFALVVSLRDECDPKMTGQMKVEKRG